MEYYLRQMLDDIEERNMQILDASETAACDKFMSDVIPVCLFWRPQLIWERHQRIGGSRDDLVERIRTECATASDEMRLFCIGGAGQTAVSAGGYERSSVVGMCEALAADTREFVACVGTGARAIGGATSHERGVAVCEETFEDDERAECLIYLRSPGFGAVL